MTANNQSSQRTTGENMNRRQFIQKSLIGLTLLPQAGNAMGTLLGGVGQDDFIHPVFPKVDFYLPDLEQGQPLNGKQRFTLTLQQGKTKILPDVTTQTIGINQDFLGPVIRIKKGQKLRMEVTNQLNEVAALHWHGMILPATEDGGPHQPISPGKTWIAEWDVINEPSTLFYHSHTHQHTGSQVWRGLGGQMQVVDEERDAELGLPHEYGMDDFPVILMDRAFDETGEFIYSNERMNKMQGMHGDTMLVNGRANSVLRPQKDRIRLRLHNASNARFYDLVFSDKRSFQVIAGDGGLLETPQTLNRLRLSPAERAEILVDLSDHQPVSLKTLAGYGNLSMGMGGMMRDTSKLDQDYDLFHIDPRKSEATKPSMIERLIPLPDWSNVEIAQTRTMNLEMQMGPRMMFGSGGFTINGQAMQMEVINERLTANSFEIWHLKNPSMMHHPFHIHNTQFKILDRNGQEPYPWEQGLKDTVTVHRDETVRILLPTGPYHNNQEPYMYHCHILEHEDAGMMGQFVVTT